MAPRYKDISTRTKISAQLRSTQARQGELIGTDLPYNNYQLYGGITAVRPSGRLSLVSGEAVPVTNVSSSYTLYLVPFLGNVTAIYDGSSFGTFEFEELTLDTSVLTLPGTAICDVFDFLLDGAVTIGVGPEWATDNTRGSGAGTTELVSLSGLEVNANEIDIIHSSGTETVPANQATYRGTLLMASDGQMIDNKKSRFVWNAFNRMPRTWSQLKGANSWTYNSTTWRPWDGDNAMFIDCVIGLRREVVSADVLGLAINDNATLRRAQVGIGDASDSVNSATLFNIGIGVSNASRTPLRATIQKVPEIGLNYFYALERSSAAGTMTFYGDDGDEVQSGITGTIWT